MQRRNFIKNTALSAIAVSATGFVYFNGQRYVGDEMALAFFAIADWQKYLPTSGEVPKVSFLKTL